MSLSSYPDHHLDEEDLLDEESMLPDIPKHHGINTVSSLFFLRAVILLYACSLSIGSHYASYILSPLQSRLSREMGTSNTEFGLLISAFSLNSTWTPLVGGLLASKLGVNTASVLATGAILAGQLLLLLGDVSDDVRLMVLGMFVFGLGVSPLAVVQETLIVRFFKGHGLGVSMALGLVVGKGASFLSANTSYPLTETYGSHSPFYLAALLCALSFFINAVYVACSGRLLRSYEPELNHSIHEEKMIKHSVRLKDISGLGDTFWAYIGLNVLSGVLWLPFPYIAADVLERRYSLSELEASNQASYLLVGSIFLYPLIGFVTDRVKNTSIILRLLMTTSFLTMFTYAWLALPPSWTKSPIPAIATFGTGVGYSPLLLVIIVPLLVSREYVPIALGTHKSMEQAGATIFQTITGLILDTSSGNGSIPGQRPSAGSQSALQHLLNGVLAVNVGQLLCIIALAFLLRRGSLDISSSEDSTSYQMLAREPMEELWNNGTALETQTILTPGGAENTPLDAPPTAYFSQERHADNPEKDLPALPSVRRRGKISAAISAVLVVFTWLLFLGTAGLRLRSTQDRVKSVI